MNLKEMLKKAMENMANVKAALEAGEKTADDLNDAIKAVEEIKAKMKAAEDAENLIKSLGTKTVSKEEDEDEVKHRSLGEYAASVVKSSKASAKQKFDITAPEFKAAATMLTPDSVKPALTDIDTRIVEGYRRPLLIADLFSTEKISGSALTYFVESGTIEGGPDIVEEGGKKPQMSFGAPEAVTVALAKIASYMKESAELVEDAPWLADAINGRGMYQHELKVEDYLVETLAGTSGIGTSDDLTADGIFKAMMAVQNNSGFAADAIVLNPADYQTLRLAKDGNEQYYGGGYFYAPYGTNGIIENPPLWGLRTVVTSAVAQGKAYVGAFKMGASIVRKSGVTVNIANTNEDDFIHNLITILIEERLALAVRRPAAFVEIGGSQES